MSSYVGGPGSSLGQEAGYQHTFTTDTRFNTAQRSANIKYKRVRLKDMSTVLPKLLCIARFEVIMAV